MKRLLKRDHAVMTAETERDCRRAISLPPVVRDVVQVASGRDFQDGGSAERTVLHRFDTAIPSSGGAQGIRSLIRVPLDACRLSARTHL